MDNYERIDVEQADITALMSTLIGVPIPRNSEGVLPIGYIHYNRAFSAEGLFANVRQLLEQLRVKEERLYSNSLPFLFRPFSKLTMSEMVERRINGMQSVVIILNTGMFFQLSGNPVLYSLGITCIDVLNFRT